MSCKKAFSSRLSSKSGREQIETYFKMNVISAVFGIFLLALSTAEGLEYRLQCTDDEVGIRWPSYINIADYYVCQREGGNMLVISCKDGELFSFVFQQCTSPDKYIPAPTLDILPTSAPILAGYIPSDQYSHFIQGLPKPLTHKEPVPQAPSLTEESNGPDSSALESSTTLASDADLTTAKPPLAPQPPKPSVVRPPMPSKLKPPVKVKPSAPMPPTPAPTPPVLNHPKSKPAAVTPPSPARKRTPPMPKKAKKN